MSLLIIGSIQLGLIYGLLGMGLYVPFRVLDISDMTTQGSFTLGMVVAGVLTVAGYPVAGLFAAMLCGAISGLITGVLHTKFRISAILAGILTMTGLYTVNLYVMSGKANISLIGKSTIFTDFYGIIGNELISETSLLAIIAAVTILIVAVFFKTRLGIAIRATGDNDDMVRNSSINSDRTKCIGLAIGNALTALSGALLCHYNLFADVNSGTGVLVVGLASIIIGETLFRKNGVTRGLIITVLGSIVYRLIIALALKVNLLPSFALNLISTLIVIVALGFPTFRGMMNRYAKKRRVSKNG
ncbi:ABC transporter permease [Parasporobacterium paucivorans]|uniref:Putative ABC transport system permease protein n=1 Tax=Parasporobacterium paucivorans DSM 15970 TaxID=1122934 RepID=A0A1M6JBE3_9FIRM|nr:ABC transporter permease [Parasporobacterium paucivorans]SHJ44066.1 putative ABC transport system permease protein [Parasporobacterium paucivorans DSM 15970]